MKKEVHVVPNGSQWDVKISGNTYAQSTHNTQGDAINSGKPIAQMLQTELVIHRPDGRIRDKDSYGNDPFPPKDYKN